MVTGGGTPQSVSSLIREAAFAGVDLVQIRERSLDDRALLALTRDAVEHTRTTGCRVIVNDRVDIAVAAGAAGVHLRGDSFSGTRVRQIAPEGFLIVRSVHDVEQATAAAEEGCDYLIFGTVFLSRSKPAGHPVAGLDALRRGVSAVPIPVIAIGGISAQNTRQVLAAGAAGVAGIDLFRGGVPLDGLVRRLRQPFD